MYLFYCLCYIVFACVYNNSLCNIYAFVILIKTHQKKKDNSNIMKRSRAPNFTNAELMVLLSLIEQYPIIESKKTDGATTKDKQEAWQRLALDYNSCTPGCPRTIENLIACFKNQKIKVKKMHSYDKMSIKVPHEEPGPSSTHKHKDTASILDAVEKYGQDWELVSQDVHMPSQQCQSVFSTLAEEAKKKDAEFIRDMKKTGGGPPPQPPTDLVLARVKNLMGPSLEGMYTIYGGDAEFMKQQQELMPIEKRIMPIDEIIMTPESNVKLSEEKLQLIDKDFNQELSPVSSQESLKPSAPKRLDLLRKRLDPSLEVKTTHKGKKKNVSETFKDRAHEKLKLVHLKRKLLESQLEINEVQLNSAKENLNFLKEKNAMELKFLKEKYELELDLLKNK